MLQVQRVKEDTLIRALAIPGIAGYGGTAGAAMIDFEYRI